MLANRKIKASSQVSTLEGWGEANGTERPAHVRAGSVLQLLRAAAVGWVDPPQLSLVEKCEKIQFARWAFVQRSRPAAASAGSLLLCTEMHLHFMPHRCDGSFYHLACKLSSVTSRPVTSLRSGAYGGDRPHHRAKTHTIMRSAQTHHSQAVITVPCALLPVPPQPRGFFISSNRYNWCFPSKPLMMFLVFMTTDSQARWLIIVSPCFFIGTSFLTFTSVN